MDKSTQDKDWRGISVATYIIVIVFGMSSWIAINGVFNELPLFVNRLPEGWALPSYMSVIIQLANIGPLLYVVAHKLAPGKIKEWPVIYVIIVTGTIATLLLAFLWDKTSYFGNVEHSTGLLVMITFLALMDCTSSVVFLPYIGYFTAPYMTALYIGEGLSGLFPGVLGLIQGLGEETKCVNKTEVIFNKTTGHNESRTHVVAVTPPPNFSIEVYLFLLCAILACSGVAFSILHFAKFAKKERYLMKNSDEKNTSDECLLPKDTSQQSIIELRPIETGKYIVLLCMTIWLNCIANGIMPSIQSYSSLPYGSTAYTLVVRLSNIANPLACFAALFLPRKSAKLVVLFVVIGTTLASYQVAIGILSPSPPLVGTVGGSALVVIAAVVTTICFSYSKVIIATILQVKGPNALLWCGTCTQIGSCVGSILSFILVNVFKLFHQKPQCAGS